MDGIFGIFLPSSARGAREDENERERASQTIERGCLGVPAWSDWGQLARGRRGRGEIAGALEGRRERRTD